MLHIVITILKILGSVLLVILAILAVLLLLVLAALSSPIRYRLKGSYNGALQVTGRITWLFRIFGLSVKYMDDKMDIQISVFGHVPGSGSKKSSSHRKRKQKKKTNDSETIFSATEIETFPLNPDNADCFPEQDTGLPDEDSAEQIVWNTNSEEQDLPDTDLKEQDLPDMDPEERDLSDSVSAIGLEEKIQESSEDGKEKNSIPDTVKKITCFLQRPSVQKLIKKLFRSLKKIIRHLFPDELKIRGTVGFDDPAKTGRAMEAAAVLYAFYPEQIQITPSFDEEVLKGEAELKGKIVLLYLLVRGVGMALCVFFHKECIGFIREMKQQMSA